MIHKVRKCMKTLYRMLAERQDTGKPPFRGRLGLDGRGEGRVLAIHANFSCMFRSTKYPQGGGEGVRHTLQLHSYPLLSL